MEINRKTLDRLLSQDDENLWRSIRTVAAASGIPLGEALPKKEELDAVREALSSVSEADVKRAVEIISKYKGQR